MSTWLEQNKKYGTWYVCGRDAAGVPWRKALKTKKKSIARLRYRKFLKGEEASEERSQDIPTVSEFIPVYLEWLGTRRSASWANHQKAYLRNEVEPLWGKLRLSQVTTEMAEKLVDAWARKHKNCTANKKRISIRQMFKYAVKKRHIERNPILGVEPLTDDTSVHDDWLTQEEFSKLIAGSAPKLRMFNFLGYHCGLRPGESLRVQWTDMDLTLQQPLLRVVGEKAGPGKKFKIRYVPINQELKRELELYRGMPEGQESHLFHEHGKPGWSSVFATFRRAAKKAGLRTDEKQVTPGSLRHTFGTMLARQGRPMRQIQMLMGHASLAVTEKWYAHHQPEWLRGATDVLSGTGASSLPIDLPISGDSDEEEEEPSPLESSNAGVAELADAGDSKSPEACPLAGSTPASGINCFQRLTSIGETAHRVASLLPVPFLSAWVTGRTSDGSSSSTWT